MPRRIGRSLDLVSLLSNLGYRGLITGVTVTRDGR